MKKKFSCILKQINFFFVLIRILIFYTKKNKKLFIVIYKISGIIYQNTKKKKINYDDFKINYFVYKNTKKYINSK